MATLRPAWHWIGRRPWLAMLVIIVAGNAAGFAALDAQERAQEHADCVNANAGRDDLRHAFSDVLTDNLVAAARTPPDPAVVERYRRGLLDDLEREFPDRDCGD